MLIDLFDTGVLVCRGADEGTNQAPVIVYSADEAHHRAPTAFWMSWMRWR